MTRLRCHFRGMLTDFAKRTFVPGPRKHAYYQSGRSGDDKVIVARSSSEHTKCKSKKLKDKVKFSH